MALLQGAWGTDQDAMDERKVRVLLAVGERQAGRDDAAILRLRRRLSQPRANADVVAESSATDGNRWLPKERGHDVTLLYLRDWTDRSALTVAGVRAEFPEAPVCLVTRPSIALDLVSVARSGVRAWLPPIALSVQWGAALRALASGRTWLLPGWARRMLWQLEKAHVSLPLEEETVLRRIADGEQYDEIAAALGTTPREVKRAVYRALDAVITLLDWGDGQGFETSGDRAPRPRPTPPGMTSVARPLPREPLPPLHAVKPPLDDRSRPDHRGQQSA